MPRAECRHCGATAEAGEVSCSRCGSLHDGPGGDIVPCARHSDRAARALCVVCGQPVCDGCSVQKDGAFFCEGKNHDRTLEEWIRLVTLDSEFEADMLVHNLKTAGIRVKVYSLRGFKELFPPVKRFAVRIFAQRSEESRASTLLQSMADVIHMDSAANRK